MDVPPDAPWKAWSSERAQARAGDAEAIHRLRVAVKRLRAARDLAGEPPSTRLAELARALGRVRTWDLHARLLFDLAPHPDTPAEAAWEALRALLARKRSRRLKALRHALDGSPLAPCGPPPWPDRLALQDLLRRWRRMEDAEALHAARLALQAHRYSLEWHDSAAPLLDPLRALAGALGLHRDWGRFEGLLEAKEGQWRQRGRKRLAAGLADLRLEAAARRKAAHRALPPLKRALLSALIPEAAP